MKSALCLPVLAALLFSSLLAAQTSTAPGSGWNDDAQKCLDLSGDDAIAACTRAIASGQLSQDNLATSYYNRGYEYRAKGDYDQAIADETEAIRLNPAMTQAYNNRGLAYFDKGEFDLAIADYQKALQLDPKHLNAFYGLGNVEQAKGDYTQAIANYHEALQINPNFTNALINRGNAFLIQGEFDSAIADYTEALRTSSGSTFAGLLLAVAQMHKGNNAVTDGLTAEAANFAKDWPYPIVQYYLSTASEDEMDHAAGNADASVQRGNFCSMYFFTGEWQLYHGEQAKGIENLKRANDQCQPTHTVYDLVHAELKRLGA